MIAATLFDTSLVISLVIGLGLALFAVFGYVKIDRERRMTEAIRKDVVKMLALGTVLAIAPILVWTLLNDLSGRSKVVLMIGMALTVATGLIASASANKANVWRFGLPLSVLVVVVGLGLGLVDQFS